ncbi:hypothetical protein FUAX_35010 [Fulvitalea axinellae]|uniref:Uncharacterized protein n=1 Tax=Fulvitalea axinellae TaxID=1182444 RepID=A0AAU9CFV5_9BACT|nr:hypothetical protein FUAX_35010 [Fulvitalea axinellae]
MTGQIDSPVAVAPQFPTYGGRANAQYQSDTTHGKAGVGVTLYLSASFVIKVAVTAHSKKIRDTKKEEAKGGSGETLRFRPLCQKDPFTPSRNIPLP